MKTLTDEQADILRGMRSDSRHLIDLVRKLTFAVSSACEHRVTDDPDCPVCRVYRPLADADRDLHDLPDDIDTYLMNGPHPAARSRK